MGTFTYWFLGLVLAVLVGAALYDYRQNRRARKASPSATSKSDRRTAAREDRQEQATCRTGRPGGSRRGIRQSV